MRIFPLLIFLCSCLSLSSQKQLMPDSGKFIIHLWFKPVGVETYRLSSRNDKLHFSINYQLEDRGTKVPINTELILSKDFSPLSFSSRGKTGRFSTIDDSIRIELDRALVKRRDTSYSMKFLPNSFPANDDVPIMMQVLLVKFWETHGRPARIMGLPDNNQIEILHKGKDTFLHQQRSAVFDRYSITIDKWKVNYLWMDSNGEFAALSAWVSDCLNEKYVSLLKDFRVKAAVAALKELPKPPEKAATLIITNTNLIDVKTGKEHPFSAVVVKNGIIIWIGPSSRVVIPDGAKVFDAKGMYLLPGLWDMHQHYGIVNLGPALVGFGITTVRDCASEFEFIAPIKQSIDKEENVGPTIFRAGLIDGTSPVTLSIITADSKQEAIEWIKKYKAGGYEQIKIYSSVKPAIVKVICEEAHRLGLSVTGHIPRGMKLSEGIDSGMNQVNHITSVRNGFEIDSTTFTIDFNRPANKKLLEKLKEKNIVIDPTLAVFEITRRLLNSDIQAMYPSYKTWPKFLQADINSVGLPADTIAKYKMQLQFEGFKKLIWELFQAGIPIVAGTDAPHIPGYALYRELELYVSAGLTPLQAIQTATLIPAKVMGRLSQSGTIEVGKQADMILVDGNPLKKISDIEKIKWVIKSGRLYNGAELKSSVGFK